MTVIGSQATSNNSKNYMSKILDEGTLCSICADPIHDYIPKFFEDIQINPACTNCDDETESNIDNQTATVNQDRTSPSCSLTLLSSSLVPSITSSMVSHWIPITYNFFQSPGSVTTMVAHCSKLPSPEVHSSQWKKSWKKMFERCYKKLKLSLVDIIN